MKRFIKLFVLLLIVASVPGCKSEQKSEKKYPMFWTWLDYRPGMNMDSICQVMNQIGLDGLILNAPTPDDYRVAIPIAHKYGIEVYAWLWTMNLEHDRDEIIKDHPDWFSVNRKGESLVDTKAYVDYYKFMCPALPEVREHIKSKIRAYCEVEGLNGIAIDYHRFVDVILPTTLWPMYGIVQDKEYPEWDYGYHPEMIRLFQEKYGYDPREQEDPSQDMEWLQFRCDQITEVANEIAEVVHSYGKVMAASPFPTPAMSRQMVRQDWGKWNLDIVFPMVYHNFYTGDVSFIEDCTIDNVKQKKSTTTLYCGMTATDGDEMFECMDAALNNGAEGIAIFTIHSLKSPQVRKQFKLYTDSVRTLRSTTAGNPGATGLTSPNIDPFSKEVIMQGIDMRMKAFISLEKVLKSGAVSKDIRDEVDRAARRAVQVSKPEAYVRGLHMSKFRNEKIAPGIDTVIAQFDKDYKEIIITLSDYELTEEYGATKKYKVMDTTSGTPFTVSFYFYGGIISGWDVQP